MKQLILRFLFCISISCLALAGCKNTAEVAEEPEVVTIQMYLEANLPEKDNIKKLEIVLDAKDPRAQVVFGTLSPRSGTISGLPVQWEYTDKDNDGVVEQVITITGNPFAAKNFFQVHVLPAVAIAVPMKISVTAQDQGGAALAWGFKCNNDLGQDIYLGVKQLIGVIVSATRKDPCPPCLIQACDGFGNCPVDYKCVGECCQCEQTCDAGDGGTGGVCPAPDGGVEKKCIDGCCRSGGKRVGEACTGANECATGFCKDGKCCNNACTTPCHSCVTGTCLPVPGSQQDVPECGGNNACSASAACRLKNGQACTGAGACASGICVDGVCCNSACTAPCHTCTTGTCVQVMGGDDIPQCWGGSTCDAAGLCRLALGQSCLSAVECASGKCVDGRCCDAYCGGECRSCLTGTCQAVTSGDDDPQCAGDRTCSASGTCLLKNGQACTGGSVCASGKCVDGKCCDTDCDGVCLSCLTGTCLPVLASDDVPQCTGAQTCNLAGLCLLEQGQGCASSGECAAGFCKDGKCCDTACDAPCQSCLTGTCTPTPAGHQDAPECQGNSACSTAGTCLLQNGQTCAGGAGCASGFCQDQVCCDTACTTSCHTCATGTCTTVVPGQSDPPYCLGSYACALLMPKRSAGPGPAPGLWSLRAHSAMVSMPYSWLVGSGGSRCSASKTRLLAIRQSWPLHPQLGSP